MGLHDVDVSSGSPEKLRTSKDDGALHPVGSIAEAEMEENQHGQFHRSFSPRQVHV